MWSARKILLALGAVIGFFTTASLVVSWIGVYAWLCLPAIAAYTALLWFRGWRLIADDDPGQTETLGYRAFCVAILLGWSFVVIVLLVFLGILAVHQWIAVVAALVVVAPFLVAAGFMGRSRGPAKKMPADPAAPIVSGGGAKPDDLVS